MIAAPAPTDQRAGVRPITFILDDRGQIRQPVTLPIRPEDLTRTESSRATVHQTMGRDITGWVDNFGEALPSCVIAGTTGWRYAQGLGMDGFGSFEALNQLVQKDYHAAKQFAIDQGADPAGVRLLFVDALDNFAWSVVPMQFQLRRSKSRPLLFQYNITLQALATTVDVPVITVPEYGNSGAGMTALGTATDEIANQGDGFGLPASVLPPGVSTNIGSLVKDFLAMSTRVFTAVQTVVNGITNFATGIANQAIELARDMAQVGLNLFRTVQSVLNLPLDIKVRAARIAAAYNQVVCIFQNALRPRTPYEQYDDLYGASNCSSTTGGRPPSPYAGLNVFQLMLPTQNSVSITSSALFSVKAVKNADPVLAPLPLAEVERNVSAIVSGVSA